MDPISFAARLITVFGLIGASSKKIQGLRGKLRNVPKDVEALLDQIQTFESLVNELRTQLQDHRNSVPSQEALRQVWRSSVTHMQRDVQSLHTLLSKIESLLTEKSRSSRMLLLACQMLSEKDVKKQLKRIDTHCDTLTNIKAMVSA